MAHDPSRCIVCNRKLKKKLERVEAPRGNRGEPVPNWTYEDPERVVGRGYKQVLVTPEVLGEYVGSPPFGGHKVITPAVMEKRLAWVSVWDGVSYDRVYGYFCTIGHAAAYGQVAVERALKLRETAGSGPKRS